MMRHSGFTLIELLVVIAIIVVLIALLTPALDTAVYRAELASCAANQKGIAHAVTTYTSEHHRRYPYRMTMDPGFTPRPRWLRPDVIVDEHNATGVNSAGLPAEMVDDRVILYPYFDGALKLLHDPLTGGNIDFAVNDYSVWADYNMWWGMIILETVGGGHGLLKLGDRLEWQDESFNILVSDRDAVRPVTAGAQKAWASHPDSDGKLALNVTATPRRWYVAWWESLSSHERGPLDTNHAYPDNSVEMFEQVDWDDARMARLPFNRYDTSETGLGNQWFHAPKR